MRNDQRLDAQDFPIPQRRTPLEVQICRGSFTSHIQQEIPLDLNVTDNYDLPVPIDSKRFYEGDSSTQTPLSTSLRPKKRSNFQAYSESLGTQAKKVYSEHAKDQYFHFVTNGAESEAEDFDNLMNQVNDLTEKVQQHYPALPPIMRFILLKVHRDGTYLSDIKKPYVTNRLKELFPDFKGNHTALLMSAYKTALQQIVFIASKNKT